MFTGIVDHFGKIIAVSGRSPQTLRISTDFVDLVEGESIAIDGVCLTALRPQGGIFECEVSPETQLLTIAGNYLPGQSVNLERALRLSDRLGGHWVTGHVDQTGVVSEITPVAEFIRLGVGGISPEHRPYVVKKGSIAINGVSLTLNEVSDNGCSVMLIPHTLERTSLKQLHVQSRVNLEFDWMVKVVLNEAQRLALLKNPLEAH